MKQNNIGKDDDIGEGVCCTVNIFRSTPLYVRRLDDEMSQCIIVHLTSATLVTSSLFARRIACDSLETFLDRKQASSFSIQKTLPDLR